eukprot:CAMPEP_0178971950 /NCGR_PEP_ID=MMETSP0789-20121207/20658_1 /TAXON_ID=3005 /ORGANISM="Rhizosolenia setigera, Strain CCMP 1694" /LENGTH=557 /DNA_ID=CAMNT_0020659175 /DNA_START=41 /DNA_END=1710 /DNA_ORIENTATION=-
MTDSLEWIEPPFSSSSHLHKGLCEFEKSLRCPICQSFYDVPVLINTRECNHTFCSECIRKSFRDNGRKNAKGSSKVVCPVCKKEACESKLVFNRQIDEAVGHWKNLREDLTCSLAAAVTGAASESINDGKDDECNADVKSECVATRPRRNNAVKSYSEEEIDEGSPFPSQSSLQPTSSSQNTQKTSNINKPLLKRKPSTRYHKMKRKKLVELCENEGLWTTGTDDELKERHKNFVLRYNAECDSTHPRSHAEILEECKNREKSRIECKKKENMSGVNKHNTYVNRIMEASHDDSGGKITSGNKEFDAAMNANFARLIEEAKARKKRKRVEDDGQDQTSHNKRTNHGTVESTTDSASVSATSAAEIVTNNNSVNTASDQSLDSSDSIAILPPYPNTGAGTSKPTLTFGGEVHQTKDTCGSMAILPPHLKSEIPSDKTDSSTKGKARSNVGLTGKRMTDTNNSLATIHTNSILDSSPFSSGFSQQPLSQALTTTTKPTSFFKSPSSEKKKKIKKKAKNTAWNCPACTFKNEPQFGNTVICKMCGTAKPTIDTTACSSVS